MKSWTVLSLLLTVACPLIAQPTEEPQPIEELPRAEVPQEVPKVDESYVITATQNEEKPFDLPFTTALIDAKEVIRSRQIQDALLQTPGVALQRTSYGQTSPYLRGLTGYHTVLLIDGIRMNNAVLRSGPNEYWGLVDGLSIDRIEAVLGPSSVRYGSDSVGGTVNAIPLRRQQYGESSWERRVSLRWSEAENSLTGRAQVSGNVGSDFGFLIGGDLTSFGDLRGGDDIGRQRHTGYSRQFGDVALDAFLDENWSIRFLGQIARVNDIGRTHRTVFHVPFQGTSAGNELRRNFDFERDLAAIWLEGQDLNGFADRVTVRLSWQRISEERDRVRSDGRRDLQGFEDETFGLGVEFQSDTPIGRLSYGVDWYHDEVSSFRNDFDAAGNLTRERIQGPVGDDASYDLLGIYVQDRVTLVPTLDLVLGARFTYAAADANEVEDPVTGNEIGISDSWTAVVGSARLLWSPNESWRLFGGVSRAFRAPNLSDLTRFDSARSNEIELPSDDLDPETFWSLEAGARFQYGGFAVDAAYYYTFLQDLIIRQPTGMIVDGDEAVLKRNGGDGHVQGVDIGVRWAIDQNWSMFGTFQWVDGQAETFPTSAPVSQTEAISRLTPVNGTIGVRWQTSDEAFYVRAWANIFNNQDRLNTRDQSDGSRIPPGGTPGYTIFNAEVGYNIDDKSRIFLAVENLSDKNYRIHGSGLQEPGANLIMGLDLTF